MLIVDMGGIYMYIDSVYGSYVHVCWLCIRVLCKCKLMVYMGAMYIDCVYGCYIHVCWLYICVLFRCILLVYMGFIYTSVDCEYGCYIHVYWWCIWVLENMYIDGVYVYVWYMHVYWWCISVQHISTCILIACYIHAYSLWK